MAGWSSILRSANQKFNGLAVLLFKKSPVNNQIRCMSEHRVMNIQGSRWQWEKTKDMLHFYFALGIIPLSIMTFIVYVFVGPAQLQPIPEGYVPKHWEYYRNPITRFMARYINNSPQQEYEKHLNVLYLEQECMKARALQQRIEDLIDERRDYRYFVHVPASAKFLYQARKIAEQKNRM